jgi:hypothetical protein
VLNHGVNVASYLVVADTPNAESLELKNREISEAFELLADAVNDVIGLVSATIRMLFSLNRLAALWSHFLLLVFLRFHFYGFHKKLLQRYAQKFIESLKLKLGRI